MAIKQGMCKNCGSLVMYDDRDELCECVFCNCVFSAEEASKIYEDPNGYEFKNEKFEKQEGSKHYYANPVMPNVVEKAVLRDTTSKAQTQDKSYKLKPNEFEISPNDVKAPTKFVIGLLVGIVAFIGIVIGITLPFYLQRKALTESISADANKIFVNSEADEVSYNDFSYKQFNIYGLTCQYVKLGLSDEITEDQAKNLYSNYVALRAEKRGDDSGDVEMYIYSPTTVFHATKDGLTKDVQTPVTIKEPSETGK